MEAHALTDAVSLRGVEYKWNGRDTFALSVGALQIPRGERLLLLGPSGSGKSTLLSLLTGIVVAQAGSVAILGQRLDALGSSGRDRFRAEHFGIIFQMFNLLPYGSILDAPHNEWLRFFAEEGLFVGVAGLVMALVVPVTLARTRSGYLPAAAAATAAGVFVMACFNNPFLYTQFNVPTFMVIGAGLGVALDAGRRP